MVIFLGSLFTWRIPMKYRLWLNPTEMSRSINALHGGRVRRLWEEPNEALLRTHWPQDSQGTIPEWGLSGWCSDSEKMQFYSSPATIGLISRGQSSHGVEFQAQFVSWSNPYSSCLKSPIIANFPGEKQMFFPWNPLKSIVSPVKLPTFPWFCPGIDGFSDSFCISQQCYDAASDSLLIFDAAGRLWSLVLQPSEVSGGKETSPPGDVQGTFFWGYGVLHKKKPLDCPRLWLFLDIFMGLSCHFHGDFTDV